MKKPIALALVLSAFASVAHADTAPVQGQSGFTLGGLGGLATPSSSTNASTRFSGGLVADYRVAPEFDVGAISLLSSKDESGASFKTLFYGVEGNYHISAVDGLAVGARLGFTSVTVGIPAISLGGITVGGETTQTALSMGPHLTYDYKIASQVSVGLDAGVNFVTKKDAMNSFSVINTLASVKYWF
jgi:hypothetical protein